MQNINGSQLRSMAEDENAVILDVRTPEEVAEGMIENAINMDVRNPSFQDNVDELDPDKTYLMVCRSGARSAQAGMYLESIGCAKVYNLEGGMLGWDGETVSPN